MVKDRKSKDITEADKIRKRWQEYTEELYKKSLNEVEEPRAYSTDKSKSERERISFDFQNHVPWHHSLRMNLSPMIV